MCIDWLAGCHDIGLSLLFQWARKAASIYSVHPDWIGPEMCLKEGVVSARIIHQASHTRNSHPFTPGSNIPSHSLFMPLQLVHQVPAISTPYLSMHPPEDPITPQTT